MPRVIQDVMTPDPITMPATTKLADAAARMRDANIGDVMVMRDGDVCGIVTDRDIVVRAVADGKDPNSTRLDDVCSEELTAVSPQDSVDDAVLLMCNRALRRLPVLDEGRPVGIVSLGDLAIERDPTSALATISAANPNT